MYFPFQNVRFLVGVCSLLCLDCLVTLQIPPNLNTGVIKSLDFGGIFINAKVWANFEVVFSSQKAGIVWVGFIYIISFLCDVSEGDINKTPSLTIIQSIPNLTVQQYCGVLHGNLE